MFREWIVDGAEITATNYRLNAATEIGNKVLEECVRVAAVGPTYYSCSGIEGDDEQVEMRIGANGVPRGI